MGGYKLISQSCEAIVLVLRARLQFTKGYYMSGVKGAKLCIRGEREGGVLIQYFRVVITINKHYLLTYLEYTVLVWGMGVGFLDDNNVVKMC